MTQNGATVTSIALAFPQLTNPQRTVTASSSAADPTGSDTFALGSSFLFVLRTLSIRPRMRLLLPKTMSQTNVGIYSWLFSQSAKITEGRADECSDTWQRGWGSNLKVRAPWCLGSRIRPGTDVSAASLRFWGPSPTPPIILSTPESVNCQVYMCLGACLQGDYLMGGNISRAGNHGLNKAEVNTNASVSLCFMIADAMLTAAWSPAAPTRPSHPRHDVLYLLVAFWKCILTHSRRSEKAKTWSLSSRLWWSRYNTLLRLEGKWYLRENKSTPDKLNSLVQLESKGGGGEGRLQCQRLEGSRTLSEEGWFRSPQRPIPRAEF